MENLSLRERKFAKTKINITNNVIGKLAKTPFDNISIKEVCHEVEISEATFYNYFPKKTDIIDYFTSLRLYRHFWTLKQVDKDNTDPILTIKRFFEILADNIEIPVFNEIFAFYVKEQHHDNMRTDISVSEKIYAFPECEGIENLKQKNTRQFLTEQIEDAIAKKILKPDTDVYKLATILLIILYGSLIFAVTDKKNDIKTYYETQLNSTFESLKLK